VKNVQFLQRVSIAMIDSVCHSPVSCQNDSIYDHAVCPMTGILSANVSAKFQRERREWRRRMREG